MTTDTRVPQVMVFHVQCPIAFTFSEELYYFTFFDTDLQFLFL